MSSEVAPLYKFFKILDPDSELGNRLLLESPTLVSPMLSEEKSDQHNKTYSPLLYFHRRPTYSQNFCQDESCSCGCGIWVSNSQHPFLFFGVVVSTVQCGTLKRRPGYYLTDLVIPERLLFCIGDRITTRGFLRREGNILIPTSERHEDSVYTFQIDELGEILYSYL